MSDDRETFTGCLITVVIFGAGVWFWDDIISAVTEPFSDEIEEIKEAMTDCDELREEINNTKRCLRIPNCTLTRDELIQYEEDELNWYRYCFDGDGLPDL